MERCLGTIKGIADEIIIVDAGSEDRTKEAALKHNALVYDYKWNGDFSAARNYSFSKASMDYILWLDADDVLQEEDREKFKDLKDTISPDIAAVIMKHNICTDDNRHSLCTMHRGRLLKNNMNFRWQGQFYEYLKVDGRIIQSDIAVTHNRMQAIRARLENDGESLFYKARELYNNKRTEDAIVYYNRFLDTRGEPLSDYLAASMNLSQCCIDKGDMKGALKALFRSFEHDAPKAVICCWLGYYFKSIGDFIKAISWFKLAISLKKSETIWGTAEKAYCGYIPSLETAVCYFKQGDINEAITYNNKALEYMPKDSAALRNKERLLNAVKVFAF